MSRRIIIALSIDEQDMEALASEYEANESNSFIHEFAGRILEKVASTTREMCDTATAINMINPIGNVILRTEETKNARL